MHDTCRGFAQKADAHRRVAHDTPYIAGDSRTVRIHRLGDADAAG